MNPRSIPSASTLGLVVVLATATSISFSNILSPVVYALGSNPETLLVCRFGSFLVVCGLWLKIRRIPVVIAPRDRLDCVGAGLAFTIGSASLVTAFALIPVSLAVLILYTFPLITRLAECALDRRGPTFWELAWLLAALAGLTICLGIGLARLNGTGLALAFLAAVAISCSFVWTGRRLTSVPPPVMTTYMAGTGLVVALGFTVARNAWALPPLEPVATGLMAAAALSFAGAFLGMFLGVRLIGASRTAMMMNLEPVLTVALAILLLDETLSVYQLLGAALVIASIYATRIKPAPGIR
jgi:drug/metabolite transporter (DMT)-like permease